MKLACSDCARLAQCADAPADAGKLDTHSCEAWSPTAQPVIDARADLIARFGNGALSGIRKEKPNMAVNVDDLLDAVKTGDIATLNAYKADKSLQPANLMLAAARLTGDAPSLATALRSIKDPDDRRIYLIDVLIARAQSNNAANAAAPVAAPEEAAPAAEEPKRRRRRAAVEEASAPEPTQEIVSESSVIAIEEAKATEAELSRAQSDVQVVALHGSDIDTIVGAVSTSVARVATDLTHKLDAISERQGGHDARLIDVSRDLAALAQAVNELSRKLDVSNRNLTRVRNAFVGFEIELIGSGTVNSTPFADATSDWEE